MSQSKKQKKQKGKVLVDNYWIAKSETEQYQVNREEAAQKALAAMRTFCQTAERQWAGSEDGEAVVGYNADQNIRSIIHLNPQGVQLILSLNNEELIRHLQ